MSAIKRIADMINNKIATAAGQRAVCRMNQIDNCKVAYWDGFLYCAEGILKEVKTLSDETNIEFLRDRYNVTEKAEEDFQRFLSSSGLKDCKDVMYMREAYYAAWKEGSNV